MTELHASGPDYPIAVSHPNGELKVSAGVADALQLHGIQGYRDEAGKPNNQPFVNVHMATQAEVPGQHKPFASFSVDAPPKPWFGRGREDVTVTVALEDPAKMAGQEELTVDPLTFANQLGGKLAERLHGNRVERIAKLGATAVLAGVLIATGGAFGLGLAAAAGTYAGAKILGRTAKPKHTFSSRQSYAHAERVADGVVATIARHKQRQP